MFVPKFFVARIVAFSLRANLLSDAIELAIMVPQLSDVINAVDDLKSSISTVKSAVDILTGITICLSISSFDLI